MAKDYAQSARMKKQRNKKEKASVPAWVWLFTGTVTGLFIAGLVYLAGLTPEEVEAVAPKPDKPQSSDRTREKPRFDFYERLKETEVEHQSGPEPESGVPSQESVLYVLQAGSFRGQEEADGLRAELLLLGLDATIEPFQNRGDTWHRVMVGPFESRQQADEAKASLVSQGIDPLMLKKSSATRP